MELPVLQSGSKGDWPSVAGLSVVVVSVLLWDFPQAILSLGATPLRSHEKLFNVDSKETSGKGGDRLNPMQPPRPPHFVLPPFVPSGWRTAIQDQCNDFKSTFIF